MQTNAPLEDTRIPTMDFLYVVIVRGLQPKASNGTALHPDMECVKCTPGKWESGGICELCVEGQYQRDVGQTECTACEEGSYNEINGSTSKDDCTKCPAGRYSPAAGASSIKQCIPCPAGRWSENKMGMQTLVCV